MGHFTYHLRRCVAGAALGKELARGVTNGSKN